MATQSIYLQNFLNDPDKSELIIPIYQRPYSWTSLQIDDLFDDIKYLINVKDSKHFMGLLVLTNNSYHPKSFDIIDGQQRLTSICILLAIIRDKLDDIYTNNFSLLDKNTQQKISGALNKIDSCLYDSHNHPLEKIKLTTYNEREYEQEFLANILCKLGSLDAADERVIAFNNQPPCEKNTFAIKLAYMNGELKKKFHKNKVKARRSYRNYIEMEKIITTDKEFITYHSKTSDSILFYSDILLKAILEKISVVDFVTKDYSEAFNIFEVLNDRGLAISSTDLIKNLCLKKIDTSKRDVVFSFWKQIFDQELNGLDSIQFLRYSNNSRRTFITKKDIYKTYDNLIKLMTDKQLLDFLESEILPDSIHYKTLKKEEFQYSNININNAIKLLQSTKSSQWHTIGLSVLRAHSFDQSITTIDKIKLILEKTHEIIFNLILTEKKANKLEKFFPEMSIKLNDYNSTIELHSKLDEVANELINFIDIEKMSFKNIDLNDIDFQSSNNYANMFLFFLDYKECPNYNLRIKTLEHILPQNAKESLWPEIKGKKKEDLDKYIYSLGNMLLIEKPLNSRIKASGFATKQAEYVTEKIQDFIDLSSPLNYSNIKSLDFKTIEDRSAAILNKYKLYT